MKLIRNRAYRQARAFGLNREGAEDIAQEVVARFIERGTGQTVRHAVIDLLREQSEGRAVKTSKKPRRGTHASLSRVHEQIADETTHTRGAMTPERMSELDAMPLHKDARAALVLMLEWGFTGREVARVLGVTESRVSQILRDAAR